MKFDNTQPDWANWQWQHAHSCKDHATLTEWMSAPGHSWPFNPDQFTELTSNYRMAITPYYFKLIRQFDDSDPLYRQIIPDPVELQIRPDELEDPIGDEHPLRGSRPLSALIHRYPDRVIFYVSGSCASYCRFCTRKRKVGCADMALSFRELREGIDYIAADSQIRDVIFSGGDPLLLPDPVLQDLLARVYAIPHVEMIRIGTRVPVTLPERITDRLCAMLKKFQPLYLNTHFNHPRELTEQAAEACARLADAGIVLGNQTVLLRGVNDQPEIISVLFRGLLKMR
ncbi:MAG: KamA family radical SAM protein, partial [Candidatus Marinimicrobia bacterium]|nr:KamA family radical SAM protein [Candidatus Neomarinimicrobiota bacterium]